MSSESGGNKWKSFGTRFLPELAAGLVVLSVTPIARLFGLTLSWHDLLIVLLLGLTVALALGVRHGYRALEHRRAAREERRLEMEHRITRFERAVEEHDDAIGRLEAAAMTDIVRAARAEGWTVDRADPANWGPSWFEFRSPDGASTRISGVEAASELAASLRQRGDFRLDRFPPTDWDEIDEDWSPARLWRGRETSRGNLPQLEEPQAAEQAPATD